MLAVDIAGFTKPHRDDEIRLYLHGELYELLQRAFDGSDIPWADCFLPGISAQPELLTLAFPAAEGHCNS